MPSSSVSIAEVLCRKTDFSGQMLTDLQHRQWSACLVAEHADFVVPAGSSKNLAIRPNSDIRNATSLQLNPFDYPQFTAREISLKLANVDLCRGCKYICRSPRLQDCLLESKTNLELDRTTESNR